MKFSERIKSRLPRIHRPGAARIAPTASMRKVYPAGDWFRRDSAERLASLCRAAGQALIEAPLFAASFDGNSKLSLDDPLQLQVGIGGGARWLELIDAQRQGEPLAAKIAQCAETERPRPRGLEILDLSDQGVSDWRGTLLIPRIARLVLLGSQFRPGPDARVQEVVPLVIDYSIQATDSAGAAAFLDRVAQALGSDAEGAVSDGGAV